MSASHHEDQFFASLQEDDASMNSSGRSSDEDEEALKIFNASIENSQQTLHDFLEAMDEDDEEESGREWGKGSQVGKAPNKARDFEGTYTRLIANYFNGEGSKYDENDFERRFRMPRVVFYRIYGAIFGKGLFVQSKLNFSGKKGIHPLVRLTACLRRLAYGDSADREDENLEMAESTINKSLKDFCKIMKSEFGHLYLNRCPSPAEIERSTTINAGRGFPGMFASWDCKHFAWKNCPVALAGQHKGKESEKTLVLEAIADPDLYIWYYFFGEAGSLNDINILNKSSIIGSILDGSFDIKTQPYTINETTRDWLYFLVDGIYPGYSIFINSINHPQDEKEKYFATCQEACRKDIERAFGVLVQQFQILQRPIKSWYWEDIVDIMDVCILLHNMVVENRRQDYSVSEYIEAGLQWYAATDPFRTTNNETIHPPVVSLFHNDEQQNHNTGNILTEADLSTRMAIRVAHLNEEMKNQQEHFSLKSDLMIHLWARKKNRRRISNNRDRNGDDDDDDGDEEE
jgi:hypothetical protein